MKHTTGKIQNYFDHFIAMEARTYSIHKPISANGAIINKIATTIKAGPISLEFLLALLKI